MNEILNSFRYCLDYLREQVEDVSEKEMVSQPSRYLNHPAWTLGHISASCHAVARVLGGDAWLPEDWGKRFGTGSLPVSDVAAYETKTELINILSDSEQRIIAIVKNMNEEQLGQALTEKAYVEELPTYKHALNQMLVAHTATHIGQLTVWRNLMQKPPVSRHFL